MTRRTVTGVTAHGQFSKNRADEHSRLTRLLGKLRGTFWLNYSEDVTRYTISLSPLCDQRLFERTRLTDSMRNTCVQFYLATCQCEAQAVLWLDTAEIHAACLAITYCLRDNLWHNIGRDFSRFTKSTPVTAPLIDSERAPSRSHSPVPCLSRCLITDLNPNTTNELRDPVEDYALLCLPEKCDYTEREHRRAAASVEPYPDD